MIHILLFCAMLLQGGTQATLKPAIDNDRVAVWDVTDSVAARPGDAVVISFSGTRSLCLRARRRKSPADPWSSI